MFQPQPYPYPWGGVTPPPNYGQPQLNNLQQVAQQAPATAPQQQPNQNGSFCGRVVSTFDEIKPSDIPTDGTIGLFPQSDYSCIFAKQWNNDGSISTVKFVPEPVEQQPEVQESDISVILDRIDNLETLIRNQNRPKKPYNKNYRPKGYTYDKDRNAKVEVSENESA